MEGVVVATFKRFHSLTMILLLFSYQVSTGQTLAERGIEPLSQIPINGFINDIAIGPKARFCAVAVGQEPRLGRWNRVGKAKNRLAIVKLDFEGDAASDDGEDEAGSVREDYNEPPGVDSGSDDEEED